MEKSRTKTVQIIQTELDEYYGNLYIYPTPDWALLHTQPELIYLLPIYGEEGIKITKQKVDFEVDFSNGDSILQYGDFLFQQMDTNLEIIAYVVFYNKNLRISKHPNYDRELTEQEQKEQQEFNDSQPVFAISVHYFNQNLASIEDLSHWKQTLYVP